MSAFEVPIVLVVFNRPERVAESLAAVRAVRPSTLFVIADGPRVGHPDDAERRQAALAVVDTVDWRCEVVRNVSVENLGTDHRIPSGLDWVFTQADRAIVLEDDIVPVPGFFPWCAAMLDRYDGVDDVVHVSGRNTLVHWPTATEPVDHVLVRRGSISGWATWASAWRAVDHDLRNVVGASDVMVETQLDPLDLDPLVHDHLVLQMRAAAHATLAAWDVRWDLARILAGGWSVISPANLVANRGYGADATRTVHADDLGAHLPCGDAPALVPHAPRPDPDPDYDRRSLLVDLMAGYRNPAMAARLARSPTLLVTPDGEPDLDALHHLSPFTVLDESIAVVDHLRRSGVRGLVLGQLDAALRDARAPSRADSLVTAGMDVGVVVAVRNGVDTIEATLESVLGQDPPPADVVVLDGSSTDGTVERAASIPGVRVVPQVGLGLGAARNQALRTVRGALVAFCDSDDRWADGALRMRIEHLAAHAECDAVVGHAMTVPVEDTEIPVAHRATLGAPRPGFTPGALLARRVVFDRVGPFAEDLRIGSDSDWFVRLRESDCRVDVLDDVVLMKGVRAESLSNDAATYREELMNVARAYVERRRLRG